MPNQRSPARTRWPLAIDRSGAALHDHPDAEVHERGKRRQSRSRGRRPPGAEPSPPEDHPGQCRALMCRITSSTGEEVSFWSRWGPWSGSPTAPGMQSTRIEPALAAADGVELDVHLLRGRLEVRHSKAIWPIRIYWERGQGIVDEQVDDLRTTLAAAPAGARLWVDLKGVTPRLTSRVVARDGSAVRPDRCRAEVGGCCGPPTEGRYLAPSGPSGIGCSCWFALRIDHPDGVGDPRAFRDRADRGPTPDPVFLDRRLGRTRRRSGDGARATSTWMS